MAFEIVVVGTSTGGLKALQVLLSGLPADFPLPVVIVQHRGIGAESGLCEFLGQSSSLPVSEPEDKEPLLAGHAYLAPRDYHLLIANRSFALSTDPPVGFARPSIDVLFESAADEYGERAIGVILTGANRDGARGLAAIKSHGGLTLVEEPCSAVCREMPDAALAQTKADWILPLEEIATRLAAIDRRQAHRRRVCRRKQSARRRCHMEAEERINILMVDDSPTNLLALESILHAPDRNLVSAASGDDALRYLLDNEVAVILMDVYMPELDGLETAELIRGRDRSRNIPIIFLTADSTGGRHLSRGYSLGAVDYIVKPIEPDILRSKVAVFVELFKKTQEIKRQAELLEEKNLELENANLARLNMLIDLGQELASEHEPARVLENFCRSARNIVEAQEAAVGVINGDGNTLRHFFRCSTDDEITTADDRGVTTVADTGSEIPGEETAAAQAKRHR